MGIFSGSKKVYVASTVYKMVDDDTPRASFMQETITSTVLGGGPNAYLGQSIVDSYLRGPRSTQRSFFRWAKTNYDFAMPRAAINYTANIDHSAVSQHIKDELFPGETSSEVSIATSFIDISDESYFAERYIFENRPELIDTDWVADYDSASSAIYIAYPEGTEYPAGTPLASDTIPVTNFNSSDEVLVTYYTYGDEPVKVHIYKIGSGVSALDDFNIVLTDGLDAREFYPPIPIRIDNKSVFSAGSPAQEKEDDIREAYEKSVGGDIDDLITQIEDNESIDDIDYAYVVFGVSLNDKTRHGKRYIFEFLRTLADVQQTTSSDYDDYENENDQNGYHSRSSLFGGLVGELANAAGSNSDEDAGSIDGVDTATTTRTPQVTNIHLTLPESSLGVLDMKITWADIREETHTGVLEQDAKVGDVTVSLGDVYRETLESNSKGLLSKFKLTNEIKALVVRKQVSASEYVEITARGLKHRNLIYDGKSVDIDSEEAYNDEDDSGFILPLHEPTMRRLGVVQATEVSRECQLIVFNSYQVVKKKWYQKGIFKVLAVVVIITAVVVLAVVTGGASLGPSAPILGGVLGSSAAIGAALGFSGVLAIAVGTAVNVIAAMVITQLVGVVATELLGEKIGAIVSVVAQVALAIATGGIDLSSFTSNLASMSSITNLLQLTNAAADIASVIQQDQLEGILEDIDDLGDAHNEELDRLKEQYEAFGFGEGVIDPLMLTDFSNLPLGSDFVVPQNLFENSSDFINRTLMTGDDLIEMSLAMVNDFTEVSLTLQ